MTSIHELLPWYANRTLESEERAAFEEHLPGCQVCRQGLDEFARIESRLEVHGRAVLSDHPSPEQLVAALTAEPDESGQAEEEVRRHIGLCIACADEASWVMKESAAGGATSLPASSGSGPHPATRPFWQNPSWIWAAAAALLIMALLPIMSGSSGARTGIARPALVEATERDDGFTVVDVAPGAESIHLIFPVDLAPAAFPAELEVEDARGNVFHRAAVGPEDLYRRLLVFFTCARKDCPDGEYLARLIPAPGQGTATEYPFQVVTEP